MRERTERQLERLREWKPYAEMLRAKRLKMGMSLADLSEEIDANHSAVGSWERAKVIPPTVQFFRWADAIGFDVNLEEVA